MTTTDVTRLVDLPGIHPARVDANIVSCVRLETGEQGSFLVVHTNQGFAFTLVDSSQSANDFYHKVLGLIWPEKKTTKQRGSQ